MREGTKIRDYVFEEKIGEGGMGEVWRARHAILDREVAIKAMARHLEADPEFGRRFLQEAQSQARLSHPQIVGVSDFFAEDGQYFLVMPLMSGKNLADRLHELQGPLPLEEALAVARDVLNALDYAHQQGVIHRDVKPSNILLDGEGHAALTDFGIALSLGRMRVTQATTSLGTPHYMSPEQIRSPRDVDHRTDVYSFGCVFYEMLTGRPPFAEASDAEDTDFALKEAHVYRAPESLREWNPRIPAWLDAVVLRALAKNPDERFLGCGEFRRSLDAPAAPVPSVAPPPEPARAVRRPGPAPVGARRLPMALIALIGLAVAALAALVLFATRDRWQPAESAADGLTTDLGTTEPLGTDIEVIETGGTGAAAAEPGERSAGEAPLVTDTAPIEPIEQETDEGEPKKPEPEKPAPKKREPEEEADTDEPVDTDLEIRGGVVAPLDTDLGTVEPLGTDLRPPGW